MQQSSSDGYRGVWVYCEHSEDRLTRPTLEVIAAARRVADQLGDEVVALLLGYNLDKLLMEPIYYGADRVLYCDDPRLKDYLVLPYTSVVSDMVTKMRPWAMLFVASDIGKDLGPRVAFRVNTGLAVDVIDLVIEDFTMYTPGGQMTFKNSLAQVRPDFATRIAKIFTPRHRPQISSIRPGNFTPLPRDEGRRGELQRWDPVFGKEDFIVEVLETRKIKKSSVRLEEAKVIISLGLGVLKDAAGRPRNPREAYELAQQVAGLIREKFGVEAEIGASRALIYAGIKELEGLITKERQVGQTGKTVSPDIYITLGISGALQHRVGMARSKRIVAVNTDPAAPIFQIAHYGVVGDLYEFLPRLAEIIKGM